MAGNTVLCDINTQLVDEAEYQCQVVPRANDTRLVGSAYLTVIGIPYHALSVALGRAVLVHLCRVAGNTV